jgi:hypothetical protein
MQGPEFEPTYSLKKKKKKESNNMPAFISKFPIRTMVEVCGIL